MFIALTMIYIIFYFPIIHLKITCLEFGQIFMYNNVIIYNTKKL